MRAVPVRIARWWLLNVQGSEHLIDWLDALPQFVILLSTAAMGSKIFLGGSASVVSVARKVRISVKPLESLEEMLPEKDVLYVTRIQRERFANESIIPSCRE